MQLMVKMVPFRGPRPDRHKIPASRTKEIKEIRDGDDPPDLYSPTPSHNMSSRSGSSIFVYLSRFPFILLGRLLRQLVESLSKRQER